MKASLKLEFIGAANYDMLRQLDRSMPALGFGLGKDRPRHPFQFPGPCVIRFYKTVEGDISFNQVFGNRDYSKANSKGTRGVYINYVLHENELYCVKEPVSWRNVDYYYAAITPSGEVVRITESEAREWLSAL